MKKGWVPVVYNTRAQLRELPSKGNGSGLGNQFCYRARCESQEEPPQQRKWQWAG